MMKNNHLPPDPRWTRSGTTRSNAAPAIFKTWLWLHAPVARQRRSQKVNEFFHLDRDLFFLHRLFDNFTSLSGCIEGCVVCRSIGQRPFNHTLCWIILFSPTVHEPANLFFYSCALHCMMEGPALIWNSRCMHLIGKWEFLIMWELRIVSWWRRLILARSLLITFLLNTFWTPW